MTEMLNLKRNTRPLLVALLAVIQWGLALSPVGIYLQYKFEWAVVAGLVITIAFAFEILKRQIKSEVTAGA